MGLAGPKENKKIGRDPRNTFWSNDTSRFGHQYLTNLGWTPGQNLGDKTSSYHSSGHITEASSTGVKILVKDDNLGIGAKKGAQHDECTGLLGLQGLLGRLNGNEEQVKQVKKEEDRRKSEWITGKWGLKFVRGEVWVADDLTKLRERMLRDKEAKAAVASKKESDGVEEEEVKVSEEEDGGKQKKKRKRDADADGDGDTKDKKQSSKKSKLKEKKKKPRSEVSDDDTGIPSTDRESKRNKPKSACTPAADSGDETESQARKRRKEERRAKREMKDARRKDKAERKEKRAQKKGKKKKASSDFDSSSDSESESTSAAPTRSVTLAVGVMNGRNALRARFIAAKKSATMDAASLNEILMIKA